MRLLNITSEFLISSPRYKIILRDLYDIRYCCTKFIYLFIFFQNFYKSVIFLFLSFTRIKLISILNEKFCEIILLTRNESIRYKNDIEYLEF